MTIGRLFFHIGVPKTATSLIQRSMRKLQPRLGEIGITYVDRSEWLELPTYRGWAPYGRQHITPEDFKADLRKLFDEANAAGNPVVVTSNEAASGWDSDLGDPFWKDAHAAVEQVVSALQPASAEVIVYLRRQDRFLESLYMELVHIGRGIAWDTFLEAACRDGRVRYSDLLGAVESVAGVDRVHVRVFESIGDDPRMFIGDFLSVFGAEPLAAAVPEAALSLTRPSFTQPAWEAALGINHLVDTPDQFKRLRKFLAELFPVGVYPPASLLTEPQRQAVIDHHRADNERVFARYLPTLPIDTYSTAEGLTQMLGSTSVTPHTS